MSKFVILILIVLIATEAECLFEDYQVEWESAGYENIPDDNDVEEIINVIDHGANGSDYVSDLSAFTSAINAATDNLITKIIIPSGTYMLEDGLNLSNMENLFFVGSGSDVTLLAFSIDNEDINCITVNYGLNIGFEDLDIWRNHYPDDHNPSGHSIEFRNSSYCWVIGVEISSSAAYGINISESHNIEISGCYIHHSQYFGGVVKVME